MREVAALQHGQVEGVVGLLGDVKAHLQSLLDLTSGLAAAGKQVLEQELVLSDPLLSGFRSGHLLNSFQVFLQSRK